jgi:L-malate glycosyltransferase
MEHLRREAAMRITIVLPAYYNFPIGGYHVHYTYANLLQRRGHKVSLVFPRRQQVVDSFEATARGIAWVVKTRLRNRPLISTLPLERGVSVTLVPTLAARWLPRADILVATGWTTAEALDTTPRHLGRKVYIVYDYEHLMSASPEIRCRIRQTYRMGAVMVATSSAVRDVILASGGAPAAQIPCGIDFASFGMDLPPQQRATHTVGFPLRPETFKGAADAIAACSLLRDIYGERLRATAFGTHEMALPSWIRWLRSPSQAALRQFYNEQSVFMLPSHYEGWGLPGVEAMTCGAALVATDNGGSRDYAIAGKTAMVVPPGQPSSLADAVRVMFDDNALRIRLALAGHEQVQQYDWNTAADRLEQVMLTVARS